MKKILFALSFLIINSGPAIAVSNQPPTSLDEKWTCTTNASSSDIDADKTADDYMAQAQGSASKTFDFAASNCRDCTRITCESHK
jgi:hypothetical protein